MTSLQVPALPASFYARDTSTVARRLLGQRLASWSGHHWRIARIVETEAYLGPHDLACHSAKGRTKRTEVMFGPPGIAYVFLIYGMHRCFNVVTGNGAAVLIRAVEPLEGFADEPTHGPGRLAKAMAITLAHSGHDLSTPPLLMVEGAPVADEEIVTGPRIGVDYAKEWAAAPLRFFVANSPFISVRPKRGLDVGTEKAQGGAGER